MNHVLQLVDYLSLIGVPNQFPALFSGCCRFIVFQIKSNTIQYVPYYGTYRRQLLPPEISCFYVKAVPLKTANFNIDMNIIEYIYSSY
ncbi:MAG TPA: hypothetical protein PL167_04570 [Cyclobacteriaceae bacterium]|nr:hypothetical protein [Cyclobacteriaceae bacterium]